MQKLTKGTKSIILYCGIQKSFQTIFLTGIHLKYVMKSVNVYELMIPSVCIVLSIWHLD